MVNTLNDLNHEGENFLYLNSLDIFHEAASSAPVTVCPDRGEKNGACPYYVCNNDFYCACLSVSERVNIGAFVQTKCQHSGRFFSVVQRDLIALQLLEFSWFYFR